jgi:hypothetical protein
LLCFVLSVAELEDIGEFELMRLHILLRLAELQQHSLRPYNIYVSLVSGDDMGKALVEQHKNPIIQEEGGKLATPKAKGSHKQLPAGRWTPLVFSGLAPPLVNGMPLMPPDSTGGIFFRDCSTLREAINGPGPISALFFNDMMALDAAFWTAHEQSQAMKRLLINIHLRQLDQLGGEFPTPVVIPPAEWDAAAERKDEAYQAFQDVMLQTRWVKVSEVAWEFDIEGLSKTTLNTLADESGSLREKAVNLAGIRALDPTNSTKSKAAEDAMIKFTDHPFQDMASNCELALRAIASVVSALLADTPDGDYYVKGQTMRWFTKERALSSSKADIVFVFVRVAQALATTVACVLAV